MQEDWCGWSNGGSRLCMEQMKHKVLCEEWENHIACITNHMEISKAYKNYELKHEIKPNISTRNHIMDASIIKIELMSYNVYTSYFYY